MATHFVSRGSARRPMARTLLLQSRTMNKIEALKSEKDGLEITDDLVRFAREGWKTIGEDDKERLKWVGVFMRRPTPGHAMMRIRTPNGVVPSSHVPLPPPPTPHSPRPIPHIPT